MDTTWRARPVLMARLAFALLTVLLVMALRRHDAGRWLPTQWPHPEGRPERGAAESSPAVRTHCWHTPPGTRRPTVPICSWSEGTARTGAP